jgi:nucleotide-binding universal stress UspA family protein
MFQRLLIATDLVDGLQRFAAHTTDLASAGAQSITFVHTVPWLESETVPREDQAKLQAALQQFQRLQGAGQQTGMNLDVQFIVRSGKPIPIVTQYIQQHQPDLVLLGTAVRNLLGEKLFGSNTQGILQQTTVPLLILRPPLLQTFLSDELAIRGQQLWQHLLVPVDGSKSAAAMIEQLRRRCTKTGAPSELTLCWVLDTVGTTPAVLQQRTLEAEQTLKTLAAPFINEGMQVHSLIRQGNPVVEVTAAARELGVSAIVTSSGNVGRFWELSIPSFAGELIRRSWHPILFLPVSPA